MTTPPPKQPAQNPNAGGIMGSLASGLTALLITGAIGYSDWAAASPNDWLAGVAVLIFFGQCIALGCLMSWRREDLCEKSIYYDERILKPGLFDSPYPSQVELLRSSILDFSCSIVSVADHGDTPVKSQLEEAASSWKGLGTDEAVKHAASRCNYYYDGFKTAGNNEPWRLFDGRRQDDDTSPLHAFEREKCPKPDYSCFLPMYRLDADLKMPKAHVSEDRDWHQSPNHPVIEQFSWTLLKKLRSYGLQSTPFKVFHAEPRENGLKCFPWLIVEHKKEAFDSETRVREVVYCQAANAAACAVQLNVQAAKYALKSANFSHIPPIPVITTIGPELKIWIMYYAQNFDAPVEHQAWRDEPLVKKHDRGYVMRGIWEGDVMDVEDTAKFRIILENIHTWAVRVFRPLISSYIDSWKYVHLEKSGGPSDPLARRAEMIDHYQTSMPKVLDFLDNLDAINLDKNARKDSSPLLLGMLFQMIHNLERKSLVEQLTSLIDDRVDRLIVDLKASSLSSLPKSASEDRGADVDEGQSIRSSQSTIGVDDPTDPDYIDTQSSVDESVYSQKHRAQRFAHISHDSSTITLQSRSSGASTHATASSGEQTRPSILRFDSPPPPSPVSTSLFTPSETTPEPRASSRSHSQPDSTVSSDFLSIPNAQATPTPALNKHRPESRVPSLPIETPHNMLIRSLLASSLFAAAALACAGHIGARADIPGLKFGSDAPSDPATTGYFVNHFSLNVNNLTESIEFYTKIFGMRHVFTFNLTEHVSFTYLSHSQGGRNGSAYQTTDEILRYKNNNAGHIELFHLATEGHDVPGPVQIANTLNHIGIIVPDLEATQARLEEHGVTIYKKINAPMPSTGYMSSKFSLGDATNLADEEFATLQKVMGEFNKQTIFAADPDGNLLEILPLVEENLFG
ncbi:Lactoylglutathione lyase [Paramyrothecium foliicola]|nr:Lactoylglutathione lyase [Paramyrothecium foliicola]